ncbi:MAG: hypothetical protein M1812_000649 [Candelaria pacifica]|nr:MAG: hypothetical protein M1812_000649 [Candelaria pacifica]
MSSGPLLKAIGNNLSSSSPSGTLPDELHHTIQVYIDTHRQIDDHESQRLHDELLHLYQRSVSDRPERYAFFLECLRLLRPAIKGTERLLEWWDVLLQPTLNMLGQDKAVLLNARAVILGILVYDSEDNDDGERGRVSESFAKAILDVYMEKTKTLKQDDSITVSEAERSRLMGSRLESVLLSWGRKKPKEFLMAVEALVARPDHRPQALSLVCIFIHIQPPHLHLVLQTRLIESLLDCLMIDTSTSVISLALTTLVMFLPHIPNSLVAFLPRLFIIYSRILCWDRLHPATLQEHETLHGQNGTNDGEEASHLAWYSDPAWAELAPDAADCELPVPDHLFTFLYGLYPLNLMSYVREPIKYLENAMFPGADEIGLDQGVIRSRTEQYRRVHLLHPNFYSMTAASELKEDQWLRSDPANVVAECMGLSIVDHQLGEPGAPPSLKLQGIPEAYVPTDRIPSQSLTDDDDSTLAAEDGSPTEARSTADWLNIQSNTNASRSGGHAKARDFRKESPHRRRKRSNGPHPKRATPVGRDHVVDSPTLPAHLLPTSAESRLKEMLQIQETLRNSAHQDEHHTNNIVRWSAASESVHWPLAHDDVHQSLANESLDSLQMRDTSSDGRSPSMLAAQSRGTLTSLQREVMLLRNDLNFERFLKQQHLSHIGQLRRKYIREDTVEAETQKLINSNKVMKLQLAEAKKALDSLRKETTARQTHSRKWETELSSRIRSLREEHKQWKAQEELVRRELFNSRHECDRLRKLVVASEERELNAQQKMQSIQLDLNEMEDLRSQLGSLNVKVRNYQEAEEDTERAIKNDQDARRQLQVERLKFESHDADREKTKRKYEQRIMELQSQLESTQHPMPGQSSQSFQSMLDSALATSQNRFTNLKKAHNHLLNRYTELEMKLIDFQAEQNSDGGKAYVQNNTNGRSHWANDVHSFDQMDIRTGFRKRQHAFSDASLHPDHLSDHHSSGQTSFGFPDPPNRFESQKQRQAHASGEPPAGIDSSTAFETSLSPSKTHQSTPESLLSSNNSVHSSGSNGGASAKQRAKIKAGSEIRVYGRGGVQNIGKKNKKDKEKKSGGTLKGIRGFV